MKQYETMYIVKSSLEEAARKELMESMHGIITAHGGKIDKVDEYLIMFGEKPLFSSE